LSWRAPVSAEDIEEIVGQHMVAEALLTAHLVAVAERAGLGNEGIRAIFEGRGRQLGD
jgi:hypothetical protein